MAEKRVGIYSADGLSKKIAGMGLSKREALQVRDSINQLEIMPVAALVKSGKAHKIVGNENIYVYRVNKRTRLMVSPLSDVEQVGAILYDVIDVDDKFAKRGILKSRKLQK